MIGPSSASVKARRLCVRMKPSFATLIASAVAAASSGASTIETTEPPARMSAPLREAPVVLVICLDLAVVAATDQNLDRVAVVPGASVYPFVWNVLLAARNEGCGGVLTTMAVAEEPRVKELLGVPDPYVIAAVVPLGKPVRQVTKLRRRPVPEFATCERFDGAPFGG